MVKLQCESTANIIAKNELKRFTIKISILIILLLLISLYGIYMMPDYIRQFRLVSNYIGLFDSNVWELRPYFTNVLFSLTVYIFLLSWVKITPKCVKIYYEEYMLISNKDINKICNCIQIHCCCCYYKKSCASLLCFHICHCKYCQNASNNKISRLKLLEIKSKSKLELMNTNTVSKSSVIIRRETESIQIQPIIKIKDNKAAKIQKQMIHSHHNSISLKNGNINIQDITEMKDDDDIKQETEFKLDGYVISNDYNSMKDDDNDDFNDNDNDNVMLSSKSIISTNLKPGLPTEPKFNYSYSGSVSKTIKRMVHKLSNKMSKSKSSSLKQEIISDNSDDDDDLKRDKSKQL